MRKLQQGSEVETPDPLNILLTNGRFPGSIDLARQLQPTTLFTS